MMHNQMKTEDMAAMSNNVAKVVNGKLILSFPDAETPVVWQMDLEKAEICALEIKEDKKTKLFSLVQRVSENEQNVIASFAEKSAAVAALMATSAAMQGGGGFTAQPQLINVAAQAPLQYTQHVAKQGKGEGKKAAVLSFVLILILLAIWAISIPLGQVKTSALSSSESSSGASGGSVSTGGEAMSAEEFLKNR